MKVVENFLEFLSDTSIAMEADDITGDTINDTNDVMGNDSEGGQENDGDIDLNTDNIFGRDDKQEDTENQPAEDDNIEEEEPSKDNPDESDMSQDDTSMDDTPQEEESSPDADDPFSISRKKKLKKQLIHMFDVLTDDIRLIGEFVPNISNEATVETLSSISKNLTQCKEMVYLLLTEEYTKLSYPEILKKYVALNRIYDLSIKTLEEYFKKYKEEEK